MGVTGKPICRKNPKPTPEHYDTALECRMAGGTITAYELAHTAAFNRVAMAHSRARAEEWIGRERLRGRWLDAHCHGNGDIFVPRDPDPNAPF